MTDDFKKRVAAVVKDIASASHITRADADTLAERHDVTVRVVIAKAAGAGKYEKTPRESGLGGNPSDRGSLDPEQYGVLQPAANLGAGCLTQWLWLIVIGAVLLAVAAVFQTFT